MEDQLVRALADRVPVTRRKAADKLFTLGISLTTSALTKWMSDPEFLSLLLPKGNANAYRPNAGETLGLGSRFRCTVGVAADPKLFELIRKCHGFPDLADVPPDQDAMEFELDFKAEGKPQELLCDFEIALDVLTTKNPDGEGAIAKFLKKRGPAIQQVEYEVSDVDRATRLLAEKFRVKAIYPATRPGANGTRVNFFLVPTSFENQKVLIEFVEPAKAK